SHALQHAGTVCGQSIARCCGVKPRSATDNPVHPGWIRISPCSPSLRPDVPHAPAGFCNARLSSFVIAIVVVPTRSVSPGTSAPGWPCPAHTATLHSRAPKLRTVTSRFADATGAGALAGSATAGALVGAAVGGASADLIG